MSVPPRSPSPHIALPPGLAGIRGPMAFRPETAAPINELVDVLLRGPSTLSVGERELIASYVSSENGCSYCQAIHGAVAARHLGSESVVAGVACGFEDANISDKLKALLAIAGLVAKGGTHVTPDDIARARHHGATDVEIHDVVLLAAVFCMCNRYVDGLAAWSPDDPAFYRERAALVAAHGYAVSAVTPSSSSSK